MHWLDPDSVPTLGDWFRAGGYRTHYRGKWHISHADLTIPGTHESLMTSDADGNPVPANVDAYRRADRLDPYGFAGWIGREPHGAARADAGVVRDGVFATQVVELFDELAAARADGPWLTVASFVNPHDIAFAGFGWEYLLSMPPPPDDSVPDVEEAPSQRDSFAGRPACQEQWKAVWPKILYDQPPDLAYRRLYYYLHTLVDRAIARVLEALEASGMADDTVIVFTSDHGDLGGAHGGMVQKWYNAFDEAIRVPLIVKGPGVARIDGGVTFPTSHVDLVPTLLGLAGIDVERASAGVSVHHDEARPLPGRDLSAVIGGSTPAEAASAPIYFMTEDDVSRGLTQNGLFNGEAFEAVSNPSPRRVGDRRAPERRGRVSRVVEAEPLLRAPRRLARRARHRREPHAGAGGRTSIRVAQPDAGPRRAAQPCGGRARRALPTRQRARRRARRQAAPPSTP